MNAAPLLSTTDLTSQCRAPSVDHQGMGALDESEPTWLSGLEVIYLDIDEVELA